MLRSFRQLRRIQRIIRPSGLRGASALLCAARRVEGKWGRASFSTSNSQKTNLYMFPLRRKVNESISRSTEALISLTIRSVPEGKNSKTVDENAEILFTEVWNSIAESRGQEGMVFPREIMWLGGAPGSGGEKAMKHNEKVDRTGKGVKQDIRPTDMDPALAAKRYKSFEDQTLDALEYLGELFIYNLINAQGSYAKKRNRKKNRVYLAVSFGGLLNRYYYTTKLSKKNDRERQTVLLFPEKEIQNETAFLCRSKESLHQNARLSGEAMFSDELVSIHSFASSILSPPQENDCYPLIAQNVIGGRCEYVFNETDATNELKHQMAMDILSDRGFQASISPNHATSSASLQIEWDAPKIRS
eukprot:jgi/Bigna1/81700/fgenesh1_pg.83_\